MAFKDINQKKHEEFLDKIEDILSKVSIYGQLIIDATKQHGKTNAVMWLARELMKTEGYIKGTTKMTMFDPQLNFRNKFDSIAYIDIAKAEYVPLDEQALIIDLPFTSVSLRRQAILEILLNNFVHKRNLKEQLEGIVPYTDFYIVDEMQNVWGRNAVSGKKGEDTLTIFSECANLRTIIIGLTQRLADVATQVTERSQYMLIGKMIGDNDVNKLGRILDNVKLAKKTKTLKRGQFLFIDKESDADKTPVITFPEFKRTGKSYPYNFESNDYGYVQYVFT
jgi:hypothetical protein